MITVYHASPCPFGRKVLAVLFEKNLDHEIHKMSFPKKDHESPEYLKINPNGELPALIDEGFTVYESTAIAEYLEDEYPEPRLMPEDSETRAKVRMIDDYCDLHVAGGLGKHFKKVLLEKSGTISAEDKHEMVEVFKILRVFMGKGPYLAGKSFTIADCAAMPYLATLEALGLADVIASSGLAEYHQRVKGHRGYQGAAFEAATVS